jgi:hypothetical protein
MLHEKLKIFSDKALASRDQDKFNRSRFVETLVRKSFVQGLQSHRCCCERAVFDSSISSTGDANAIAGTAIAHGLSGSIKI